MSDIATWLARLGLDKYAETFTAHEVDFDALRYLREDDLKELGLPLGPRRKLLAAIAALQHTEKQALLPGATAQRPRSEAERRQLTVMFVDLVGSTHLSQRLDPEEMRDVVRVYQSTVSRDIIRYEGNVAKLMGDGVLAYFGWPRAHEDDPERALRAALDLVTAVGSLRTPQGEPLTVRIGIATGLVVVGDLIGEGSAQEEAVIGETPNLAARLQALADPGTIVIADSTHRLVAGLFETVSLGHHDLKGFAAPVLGWRVSGEASAESRFDAQHGVSTPLAGRADEVELLFDRWQQARNGKGQVVLLSGEPGIGKSRLAAALNERLAAETHGTIRFFCSAYHANSSLYPVIRQLERSAGFIRDDSPATKTEKLEKFLHQSGIDIAESGSVLAALLSVDPGGQFKSLNLTPQALKVRTFSALNQLLAGFAARDPVLVHIEDVHWIDPTTREWLDTFTETLSKLRVLLIVSHRPEFQPSWMPSSNITHLPLSRLPPDTAAAIINRVTGGKALPREVTEQILSKTDGVPLFIEELTKTVLESGFLKEAGDHFVLSGATIPLAIPSTIQDSLTARLDRLDAIKDVAQIGACVGRSFDYRLMAAITNFEENRLTDILRKLEDSELIFRRGVPPDASYSFKHALVQDTAYQTLLKGRRQQIHSRIASVLDSHFPEIAEAEPETLAHHYSMAGLAEKAVGYWLKAGMQAKKRSANLEAIAHLSKGLELVSSIADSETRLREEIDLQTALGVAMMAAKGWAAPEVLQACTRARELCERLGETKQLFIALCGEASYHMISGNLRAADELGERCVELARASDDETLLLEADHRQWATKYFLGDYVAAESHIDHGLAIYNPDRHHRLTYIYTGHDPGVCGKTYAAKMLWYRGYPDRALSCIKEAVALAEQVSHPHSKILAQLCLSEIHLLRREPEEGRPWVELAVAQAKEFVLPLSIYEGSFQLGWLLAQEGRLEEGIREMRENVAGISSTGAAMGRQYFLGVLAWAYEECNLIGEAASVLERAFSVVAASGAKHYVPELMRLRAELLAKSNPEDHAAEDWFRKSMTMAHNEGMKSLELRAALSLARLYRHQGRQSDAQQVLAPVYNWFTERSGGRDLIEARRCLNLSVQLS
jgi:class 3 adenylate cyclase/predicted ATPase/energy-coupling factor transporter ATP-binding protein EcfA2